MGRRNESPQKTAVREAIRDYLKADGIKAENGADFKAVMRDMMSMLMEGMLDGELDEELGYSKYDYRNKETTNSRNGHSKKTVHTSVGDMELAVPRDRDGEYEPRLVKKHQNTITQDVEEQILSMYAKGMTTGDIETHLNDVYGLDVSDSTVSRVTDRIMPIVREWQERPLEEVYAVVFMDAIHYHVRSEGRVVKKAVYVAIGIDMDGMKDVLGMYVGENESAKYWLGIVNGLRNRGVKDILIACMDGLNGFPQAVEAVSGDTAVRHPPDTQLHQVRLVQGHKGGHGGPEGRLRRAHRGGRPFRAGGVRGEVERQVPKDLQVVERALGDALHLLQVPRGRAEAHLHHQHDRGL